MKKMILVIGGAGYIGSCMVRVLKDVGRSCVVFDNLSTGHRSLVPSDVPFIKGDLKNEDEITEALKRYPIASVMHFAASSLVGESVENPLKYYENNVLAMVNLLKAMKKNSVKRLIFSSTAAVFGEPKKIPITEDAPKSPTNPYGQSKLMIENILRDTSKTDGYAYIALRYFNACGAHSSGEIGERHDLETHLIPNVLKAACGKKKELVIFGDDYRTPDGTCVRDYIHIEDLCDAHVRALRLLERGGRSDVFNLGNGNGYSIKQVVDVARRVTRRKIKIKIGPRRPGDPARLVASAAKARKILGWKPKRGLEEIIESAWAWECRP